MAYLPGSPVYGIFQARIVKSLAMSSSRGSSWPRGRTQVSYISCIGRWILYHESHLESACQCKRHKRLSFNPWVGKIPWRRAWQLKLQYSCLKKSHRQRTLVGCSPQGRKNQTQLNDLAHSRGLEILYSTLFIFFVTNSIYRSTSKPCLQYHHFVPLSASPLKFKASLVWTVILSL